MIITACITLFCLGFVLGGFFFHKQAYDLGWKHGHQIGTSWGYRQAWLKRHKPLLSEQREDWNDK